MLRNEFLQRTRHDRTIVRVHEGEKRLEGTGKILRPHPDQAAQFIRHGETVGLRIPVPVADASDALRQFQPGFAADQRVQHVIGAKHVSDVVAENRGIDRFGDEVGSAVLVGLSDGLRVIQAGEDQNGHSFASRKRADSGTGQISVHIRHHDVENHEIRPDGFKLRQRVFPARRLQDDHAGRFQCVFDEQPGEWIIVGDEDFGSRLTHMVSGL